MKLPPKILAYFRRQGAIGGRMGGRAGGKKAAANMTAVERSARARKASLARRKPKRTQTYYSEHKGTRLAYQREYHRKHPERGQFSQRVRRGILSGKISRPAKCSECGKTANVSAHHVNYEHFMNFIWLCHSCHRLEHSKLRQGARGGKLGGSDGGKWAKKKA